MRMFLMKWMLRALDLVAKGMDPELVVMVVGKYSYIYVTSNQSPHLPKPSDIGPELTVVGDDDDE